MWPTREQKIIISFLRCSLGYEPPWINADILTGDLDWDEVRQIALYHGISHLMLDAIKRNSIVKVPSVITDVFEKEYLDNLVMHMLYERALKEIVYNFNGKGIRFTVHKGLGLSALLYPEPELRPCGTDLDILVRKKDYEIVKEGLKEMGYRLLFSDYEQHEITYIGEVKFEKEIGGKKVVVDLHTDLVANHWGKVTRFQMEGYWDNLLYVKCGDFLIPYLPVDVYLFFLCIHCAANHIFHRLITFCDLDLFIRKYIETINWDYMEAYSGESGSRKALYHSLNFCRRLFETPVPVRLMDTIRPGTLAILLVPENKLLFRCSKPPKILERYMHLVLLDNPFHIFRSIKIFLGRILHGLFIRRKTKSALG
ncbi:nucleotidyltransferase family protein [Thermodesulfobacteriota bacterium]